MTYFYKKQVQLSVLLSILAFIFLFACSPGNEPEPVYPEQPEQDGSPFAKVAGFKKIPLPKVDIANQIIPGLNDMQVTNDGPYIKIQDTKRQLWSVHKFIDRPGTPWLSFEPNFQFSYYVPVSFKHERKEIFSIYWSNTMNFEDQYGMYNLNTGTPSFTYKVPDGTDQPGYFSMVIPDKASSAKNWGISGNVIWRQRTPTNFEKICEIPFNFDTDAYHNVIYKVIADAKDPILWVATFSRLYKISASSGIESIWDFSSLRGSGEGFITTVIQVGDDIVVQFKNIILKQKGTSFVQIGKFDLNELGLPNIASSGSTLYTSDGRYLDQMNNWKSFVKDGDLSSKDKLKYEELKTYLNGRYPIGVQQGIFGPVYILTPTDLIEIYPIK